jgi:uncharacterized membrane protein YhaH (DUF805 family)
MTGLNPVQWALRPLRRYGEFDDRSPRPEFWWYLLLLVCVHIAAEIVERVTGLPDLFLGYGPLRLAIGLASFVPTLAVCVRRLHDVGWSGGWVAAVWAVTAVTNMIVAIAITPPAAAAVLIVAALIQLGALAVLLILCARAGTPGPNHYGPDPYGREDIEQVFA